jgi:hypothetical protein
MAASTAVGAAAHPVIEGGRSTAIHIGRRLVRAIRAISIAVLAIAASVLPTVATGTVIAHASGAATVAQSSHNDASPPLRSLRDAPEEDRRPGVHTPHVLGTMTNGMRARLIAFASQPCIARKGDPVVPWHREGTQALGTVECRSR